MTENLIFLLNIVCILLSVKKFYCLFEVFYKTKKIWWQNLRKISMHKRQNTEQNTHKKITLLVSITNSQMLLNEVLHFLCLMYLSVIVNYIAV